MKHEVEASHVAAGSDYDTYCFRSDLEIFAG